MVSIFSILYTASTDIFNLLSPDFFQLFYAGFILFTLYSATWMLSVKMRDATLVNFLWGISFSLQALIYFYKSLNYSIFSFFTEKFSWEKLTFSILVFAHGLRLSAYLIMREVGHKEDKRYANLREKLGGHFWWFSYFFIFMASMYVNMTIGSVIYTFTNVDRSRIGHLSYWAGISMMIFGGLFGALADIQKFNFMRNKRNEGKIMDKGLWAIVRHPNYLGEIIFWWGAFVVNFSAGILWTVISPILLTFLALFITGIPLNERVAKEEFGAQYEEYSKRVPILLPFIGGGRGTKEKHSEDITSGANENKDKSKFTEFKPEHSTRPEHLQSK